jgi:hypothetical protein
MVIHRYLYLFCSMHCERSVNFIVPARQTTLIHNSALYYATKNHGARKLNPETSRFPMFVGAVAPVLRALAPPVKPGISCPQASCRPGRECIVSRHRAGPAMNAIRPDIDVAPCRQIAFFPPGVFLDPGLLQSRNGRKADAPGILSNGPTVAHRWLAHHNRTVAGHDLPPGRMP